MHPVLIRIPLPAAGFRFLWVVVLCAIGLAGWVAASWRSPGDASRRRRGAAGFAISLALLGYLTRDVAWELAPSLPLYAYGVLLGAALVVGFHTAVACARTEGDDALPRPALASSAIAAVITGLLSARALYLVSGAGRVHGLRDFVSFQSGGLVAYGGLLGGALAAALVLTRRRLRFLAWGDAVAPGLAAGVVLTSLGGYLYGSEFGAPLGASAGRLWQTLGTFPHWPEGTLDGGDGAPAFVQQLALLRGTPLGDQLQATNVSLPVHPTQLYAAAAGLLLLALVLAQRAHARFRGQSFLMIVFAYGALRFVMDFARGDEGRGFVSPPLPLHALLGGGLLLLAAGFMAGPSRALPRALRRGAQAVLWGAGPLAFVALRPASFAEGAEAQLSASQLLGLLTALGSAYFYARGWLAAEREAPAPRVPAEAPAATASNPERLEPGPS